MAKNILDSLGQGISSFGAGMRDFGREWGGLPTKEQEEYKRKQQDIENKMHIFRSLGGLDTAEGGTYLKNELLPYIKANPETIQALQNYQPSTTGKPPWWAGDLTEEEKKKYREKQILPDSDIGKKPWWSQDLTPEQQKQYGEQQVAPPSEYGQKQGWMEGMTPEQIKDYQKKQYTSPSAIPKPRTKADIIADMGKVQALISNIPIDEEGGDTQLILQRRLEDLRDELGYQVKETPTVTKPAGETFFGNYRPPVPGKPTRTAEPIPTQPAMQQNFTAPEFNISDVIPRINRDQTNPAYQLSPNIQKLLESTRTQPATFPAPQVAPMPQASDKEQLMLAPDGKRYYIPKSEVKEAMDKHGWKLITVPARLESQFNVGGGQQLRPEVQDLLGTSTVGEPGGRTAATSLRNAGMNIGSMGEPGGRTAATSLRNAGMNIGSMPRAGSMTAMGETTGATKGGEGGGGDIRKWREIPGIGKPIYGLGEMSLQELEEAARKSPKVKQLKQLQSTPGYWEISGAKESKGGWREFQGIGRPMYGPDEMSLEELDEGIEKAKLINKILSLR